MENPFRRRATSELEGFLSEVIAHCQHDHPSFLHAHAAEPSWRNCRGSATPRGSSNASGEPIPERLLVAMPRRKGAVREPIRQQTDQGVHDVSETAICFRLRVRDCLEKKTGGTSGFVSILRPFGTLRHGSTGSPTEIRDQAPGTAGSGHRGLNELGDGMVPELFGGFRIGDTGYKSGEFPGSSCIKLLSDPFGHIRKIFQKRQPSHRRVQTA